MQYRVTHVLNLGAECEVASSSAPTNCMTMAIDGKMSSVAVLVAHQTLPVCIRGTSATALLQQRSVNQKNKRPHCSFSQCSG